MKKQLNFKQVDPLPQVARAFVENNGGFDVAIDVARQQIVEDTTQSGRLYWLNMLTYLEKVRTAMSPARKDEQSEAMVLVIDVMAECRRSVEKFGVQNHHPVEWFAILSEEVGEVAKEVVEYTFAKDYTIENARSIEGNYLRNIRNELTQVAAVAINSILSLERNELK